MDEFLADLMGKIDTIGSAYVQTAYMTISTPLNVSLKILISISIAWYGYSVMVGISNLALSTIFKKLMGFTLIMAAVTSWVNYQTYIYDIVIGVPENIGTLLFKNLAAENHADKDIRHALQMAWDAGWEATSAAFAKGGIRSLGAFMVAGILAVGTIIFVVGGFIVTGAGKLFAYVLLGIGPIFIATLVFDWTRNWFMGWLNTLFNTMCILIVGYAILGFMMGLSWATIEELQASSEDFSLSLLQAAQFLFIGVIGGLAFMQVPMIAAMLAGGIALNAGQSWSYSMTKWGLKQPWRLTRRAVNAGRRANNLYKKMRGKGPDDKLAQKISAAIVSAIEKDRK